MARATQTSQGKILNTAITRRFGGTSILPQLAINRSPRPASRPLSECRVHAATMGRLPPKAVTNRQIRDQRVRNADTCPLRFGTDRRLSATCRLMYWIKGQGSFPRV